MENIYNLVYKTNWKTIIKVSKLNNTVIWEHDKEIHISDDNKNLRRILVMSRKGT
jgi:hypothetical protein